MEDYFVGVWVILDGLENIRFLNTGQNVFMHISAECKFVFDEISNNKLIWVMEVDTWGAKK